MVSLCFQLFKKKILKSILTVIYLHADAPGMQRMIKKHIREFKIKLTPLTKEG